MNRSSFNREVVNLVQLTAAPPFTTREYDSVNRSSARRASNAEAPLQQCRSPCSTRTRSSGNCCS